MKNKSPSLVLSALQSIHDDAAHGIGTEAEPQDRLSVARQDLASIRETAAAAICEEMAREKTFAAVLSVLERIAEMTCQEQGRSFDEWGQAACFADCQKIARETLASVKGGAS